MEQQRIVHAAGDQLYVILICGGLLSQSSDLLVGSLQVVRDIGRAILQKLLEVKHDRSYPCQKHDGHQADHVITGDEVA